MQTSLFWHLKTKDIAIENDDIPEITNIKEQVEYYNKLAKNKYKAKLIVYNAFEANKKQLTITLSSFKAQIKNNIALVFTLYI